MTKKRHLYEVDLMRGFIMLSVLSVHTLARFYEMQQPYMTTSLVTLGGIISSLHFTREAFMFITGLVLFITYYHRDFNPLRFWFKRLTLVAIPYVIWNAVYILFEDSHRASGHWSVAYMVHDLGHSLMFGNQYYLYYVLVTIQLYIVFPFLIYGLRRLERWHLHIFIGSFVFEMLLMYVNKFVLPHVQASSLPGILSYVDTYRERFILTYEFWFVSGAIIAAHYQRILAFVESHARALWIAFGAAVLALYGHYCLDNFVLHEASSLTTTVLQPIMIPYGLIITATIWYAGLKWSRRRERPEWKPFSRFVQLASDTSFGIFLIQPFPLYFMELAVKHMQVPVWVHFSLIPFSILFVYFSSMLFSYWLGKVPIISYCVGRKVNLPKRRRNVQSTSTATG